MYIWDDSMVEKNITIERNGNEVSVGSEHYTSECSFLAPKMFVRRFDATQPDVPK